MSIPSILLISRRSQRHNKDDAEDSPLLETVQNLPPKEREVLLLHYWQDLSPEEIASTLRINRATVYRRLERARNRLKITLEGGLPHD